MFNAAYEELGPKLRLVFTNPSFVSINEFFKAQYSFETKYTQNLWFKKQNICEYIFIDQLQIWPFNKAEYIHEKKDVFASVNITAGEVITLYPVDILFYGTKSQKSFVFFSKLYQETFETHKQRMQHVEYAKADTKLCLNEFVSVCGYSMLHHNDCNLIGHLISCSQKQQNCKFVATEGELHIVVIALCNIQKGERLSVLSEICFCSPY